MNPAYAYRPTHPVAPHPSPGEAGEAPPSWRFLDLLIISLTYIFVLTICIITSAWLAPPAHRVLWYVVGEAVGYAFWLIFVVVILGFGSQKPLFETLHWRWINVSESWLVTGAVFFMLAFQALFSVLLPHHGDSPINGYFQTTEAACAMSFSAIVVAPFFEELFFRGLLFPSLLPKIGAAPAILLTGLFFGLIHGPQLAFAPGPVLGLISGGIVLTFVRYRTRSLMASWMLHTIYNTILCSWMFIATNGFVNLN